MPQIDITELNSAALQSPHEMIEKAEQIYFQKIESIASHIKMNPQLRLILISGPSGSGKTTTANLLADKLRSYGNESLVISLDNFYRDQDDEAYPRLDDGQLDYECPDALNLDLMHVTFERILSEQDFTIPKYDFKEGRCTEKEQHVPIRNGCVIIEGLHALNPTISEKLPNDKILKIFISVSTNVMDGDEQILSGRKVRFIRRLVRDSIYRGATAERTFDIWDEVLAAEDIYLYPYKSNADIAFDTFHSFELGVMRPFFDGLISAELALAEEYARIVENAVLLADEISIDLVPETSLIREFVSGGIYEHSY